MDRNYDRLLCSSSSSNRVNGQSIAKVNTKQIEMRSGSAVQKKPLTSIELGIKKERKKKNPREKERQQTRNTEAMELDFARHRSSSTLKYCC